ncbi:hypothetical protein MFLAVUS_004419 [Mucor flavus]|uniref:Polynucleotide 5'-hydroxyl-kinase GRC3 n=1 Tax=Mucor flavus TaxID=439312 RepID=A0ABP9YVV3_9FUNG
MPPKRKTATKPVTQAKKAAKNHDQDVKEPTRVSKRLRSNTVTEEPKKIEVEQEVIVEIKSLRPLSAIAARKAAIDAGLYKEPVVEDITVDTESESEEENREGIDVLSETDEEDLDLREVLDHDIVVVPISGTTTPNGSFTPLPVQPPQQQQQISYKNKNKIPAMMDYNSVSNFKATNSNSCVINQEGDNYLFIGLKKGEDIVFMGEVMVAPLFGSISISGAVISSGREMPKTVPQEDLMVSFYAAFSPRTHSLLRITSEPLDKPSIKAEQEMTEIDEHLIEAVFDVLKESIAEFETILVVKDVESGLEDMNNVVNTFTKNLVKLNKRESSRDESLEINYLPGFHPILQVTPGVKAFKEESSWDSRTNMALQNASSRERPVVSVVCGAKDMGKSTFCRYFINRLLAKYKKVAYIETDVGQSEFTPSGLLSLHYVDQPLLGPAYTHQHIEPERSFFFGSTSPRSDPDYYLECINELVDHWKQDQEKVQIEEEAEWIPLIVNTQGWVSGVGYNLLISQIQKIEPTDIFSMRHHIYDYKNLPHTFNMDIMPVSNEVFKIEKEAPSLHYLDCVLQDASVVTYMDSFTAIQQRDITLASYFHQVGMGQQEWDFSKHMVERIPYVIDWRKNLNAVWVVYEEVKMSELLYALNGSVVGLLGDVIDYKKQNGAKNAVINNDTFTPPKYLNTQDQPAPLPRVTTCYGLGIVRAIDPSKHALLLLTPVPTNTLEKVSSIIKGELQLPLWMMLGPKLEKATEVAGVPWTNVPYITQETTEGAGANALRVRRNLLRRSQ